MLPNFHLKSITVNWKTLIYLSKTFPCYSRLFLVVFLSVFSTLC